MFDPSKKAFYETLNILGNTQKYCLSTGYLLGKQTAEEVSDEWQQDTLPKVFNSMPPETAWEVISHIKELQLISCIRVNSMPFYQDPTGKVSNGSFYCADKELNLTCNYILDNCGIDKKEIGAVDKKSFGDLEQACVPYEFQKKDERCYPYETMKLITQTYCYPTNYMSSTDQASLNQTLKDDVVRQDQVCDIINGYIETDPTILGRASNEINNLVNYVKEEQMLNSYYMDGAKNTLKLGLQFSEALYDTINQSYLPYECFKNLDIHPEA